LKTRAVRLHKPGGPEVLLWEEFDLREPGPGEVQLRQEAVGVNFVDIYQRSGLYGLPQFPAVLGSEGAGVVEAIGPDVTEVKRGDRVAYGLSPPGAYAERRNIPADRLVLVPPELSAATAAAIMLKGLTAEYLLRRTYRVKPGDTVVFHAAAGGTGSIATQWAAHLGANVIGIVGSEAKVATARRNGCAHVIVSSKENFAARVKELTGGRGAEVVYDSVGRDTFDGSLECLAPLGMLVLFGQSSGVVPPFDLSRLAKGSYFLTRPSLFQYDARRSDLLPAAAALFEVVRSGAVRIDAPRTFSLKDAAEAHRLLESRQTTGSIILYP